MATLGAYVFWSGVSFVPSHEATLRDDALKKELRSKWNHKPVSYWKARSLVFSKIDGNSSKATCVYTGETLSYDGRQPRPDVANIEHTWPRSRMPNGANADMHHLFPVMPEANIARHNFKFGNVLVPAWTRGGSKAGVSRDRAVVFEVRKEHRGDAARAMFYVSTMYQRSIDSDEEKVLREWHRQDPVSAAERERNRKVASFQKSSNPFVVSPEYVDRISNF